MSDWVCYVIGPPALLCLMLLCWMLGYLLGVCDSLKREQRYLSLRLKRRLVTRSRRTPKTSDCVTSSKGKAKVDWNERPIQIDAISGIRPA